MPADDPGARREGGKDRPRFGYEKSVEMRPLLWSGELTDAYRFDAAKGAGIRTELVRADAESAEVRATGRYGDSPLAWTIDYLFDVDGFTKVTVSLATSRPVQLRWHCFNHALLAKDAIQYLTRVSDPGQPPIEVRPEPTVAIRGIAGRQARPRVALERLLPPGQPRNRHRVLQAGFRRPLRRLPRFRGASSKTARRWIPASWRPATAARCGLGFRGQASIFTQLYMRESGLEVEEFDIRNATFPLNPGEVRRRVFWVQPTPRQASAQRPEQPAAWCGRARTRS